MGAFRIHKISLLDNIGLRSKVMLPINHVVEHVQYDLGDPRLVGWTAHSSKWYHSLGLKTRHNFHGSHGREPR